MMTRVDTLFLKCSEPPSHVSVDGMRAESLRPRTMTAKGESVKVQLSCPPFDRALAAPAAAVDRRGAEGRAHPRLNRRGHSWPDGGVPESAASRQGVAPCLGDLPLRPQKQLSCLLNA